MTPVLIATNPPDFRDRSTGPAHERQERVRFRDADGVWDGYRDEYGKFYRGTMVSTSAAFQADLDARNTTLQADTTRRTAFINRCKTLAVNAKARSQDATRLPAEREQDELLWRMARLLADLVDG